MQKKFSVLRRTFNQLKEDANVEHSHLFLDANINKLSESRLVEVLDSLSNNLIKAFVVEESYQFTQDQIEDAIKEIPVDVEELADLMITIGDSIVIINWDGSKMTIEVDGDVVTVPGKVTSIDSVTGALEGILQDYLITEKLDSDIIADLIYDLPVDTKKLIDKEYDINGDKLTINWDADTGVLALQLNGNKVEVADAVYDVENLAEVINASLENEEPPTDVNSNSPEVKKKLAILNSIIRPKLINKFANSNQDRTRIFNALKSYISNGEDENYLIMDIDQRAVVDFFFDLMDSLLINRNLTGLVSRNAMISAEYDPILESKSTKKERETTAVAAKLDILLRLGLVDEKLFTRAKRALANKKSAITIPYMRNILFDLLDKLISYIQKDPTLYNRIRINVMKEMKGTLPSKQLVMSAKSAGYEAAEQGLNEDEIPEEFSRHYFTKEAWLEGHSECCCKDKKKNTYLIPDPEDASDSYVPVEESIEKKVMKTEGVAMKSFKEFQESINVSEMDVINSVVVNLETVSNEKFESLEAGIEVVNQILQPINLKVDAEAAISAASEGNESFELSLSDVNDEEDVTISLFGTDSLADKIEGDPKIRFNVTTDEDGTVSLGAEIIVYFDDEDSVNLSDIELEVDDDADEAEIAPELTTEEFETGNVFSVVLLNKETRRYVSVIVQTDDISIDELLLRDYPGYSVYSIYPVTVFVQEPIAV